MENNCNFKPFDKVLVRYDDQHVWQIDFFSHYVRGVECPYKCLTRDFNQCIPYNGNEHLIDTTNEPSLPTHSQTQTKETMWKPKSDGENFPFRCYSSVWKNCIPYDGNERLLGTADTPERYDPNKNTLFGVRLKTGYVLEFEDNIGILFPTANGFAVSYTRGCWQTLDGVEKDSIVKIYGIAKCSLLRSGEVLWERPQKQTFTKAEIAEKFGMDVQDFEIIDEKNE